MRMMKANYNFKDHNERCRIIVRIKVDNQTLLFALLFAAFYYFLPTLDKSEVMERLWKMTGREMREYEDTGGNLPKVSSYRCNIKVMIIEFTMN